MKLLAIKLGIQESLTDIFIMPSRLIAPFQNYSIRMSAIWK